MQHGPTSRGDGSTLVAARLRRALGARNGSQRAQPPSDVARPIQNVRAGLGLPVRTQSDGDRLRKPPWTSLTRKRSLVQIQYGPPGISCSWPYQVALRGPITGPRARAEDMPRSQAHGHHRGRAQAQMLLCRRATERFRAEEALPGFRTAYLCTDRRSAPILSESVYDSTLRHPSARSFAIRRADVARRAMWRRANLDVDMLVVGAKREPSRPA